MRPLFLGSAGSVMLRPKCGKRLAMSQDLVKSISRATGLPWNEQVAGSAVTVTAALTCARARSGLAASVSILKIGK